MDMEESAAAAASDEPIMMAPDSVNDYAIARPENTATTSTNCNNNDGDSSPSLPPPQHTDEVLVASAITVAAVAADTSTNGTTGDDLDHSAAAAVAATTSAATTLNVEDFNVDAERARLPETIQNSNQTEEEEVDNDAAEAAEEVVAWPPLPTTSSSSPPISVAMSELTKPDPPSILGNQDEGGDEQEDMLLLPRGCDCPTITTTTISNNGNHNHYGLQQQPSELSLRSAAAAAEEMEEKKERDFVMNREVVFSSSNSSSHLLDPPSSKSLRELNYDPRTDDKQQDEEEEKDFDIYKPDHHHRDDDNDEYNLDYSHDAPGSSIDIAAFAAVAGASSSSMDFSNDALQEMIQREVAGGGGGYMNSAAAAAAAVAAAAAQVAPPRSSAPSTPPPTIPEESTALLQHHLIPTPPPTLLHHPLPASSLSSPSLQQQYQQRPPQFSLPSPSTSQQAQQLLMMQQQQQQQYRASPQQTTPQHGIIYAQVNSAANCPLLPGFAPPSPQRQLMHQSASFGSASGNVMGNMMIAQQQHYVGHQPQQQQQQQQQQPQRRKIRLRLEEELETKQKQTPESGSKGFLGHIRSRSRRIMFGATAGAAGQQESSSSPKSLDAISEQAPRFSNGSGSSGASGFTTIQRGSITVSWFDGTSSLELDQHVRKSIFRKLQLNAEQTQLLDMRLLDESVDPPEEIVLSPFLPNGANFLVRFGTRDTTNDGTSTPGSTYSYPYSNRGGGGGGPPDSPSAAPSPHYSRRGRGLDSKQLAQLAQQLDHLRGGETGGSSSSTFKTEKRGLLSTLRMQKVSGSSSPKHPAGSSNDEDDKRNSALDLSNKGLSDENGGEKEEEEAGSSDEDDMLLHSEDPIEARLRQITELLISDRQKHRSSSHRRQDRRQTVFVLANYFVLFLSLIAISAEIQARAPGWLQSMEAQMKNVQDCAANQEALFECVSRGDVAGLIASVILWLSRSVATRRIFLFGFETPLKLWIVVYECFVTAFCWGFSYLLIRRALNPDTRPRFLQKYWKDAVYGSLAGFNAAFMKHVLKNLIPQEAVEDAFKERPLKIMRWLPSFE